MNSKCPIKKNKLINIMLKGLLVLTILCSLSFLQKIIIGANPFKLKGYIVPASFGFVIGIILGNYIEKVKEFEAKLQNRIKCLESLLPICSVCKKIRKPNTDPYKNDSWVEVESYISNKTNVTFSHSICPECMKKLYGEKIANKVSENI